MQEFIKSILEIISLLVGIGERAQLGGRANGRIRLVNRISLIFAVTSFIQSPVFFLLTDSLFIFSASCLIGLGFLIPLFINWKKRYTLAKICLISYICLANIFFTQSLGNERLGQMLCFALITLPPMFFETEKTIWKYLCYLFPVITFLSLEFLDIMPEIEVQSNFFSILQWILITTIFSLSILSVNGFSQNVNSLLSKLEILLQDSQTKNKKLEESQFLLKESKDEMVVANRELIKYKNNLERMVEERTKALDLSIRHLELAQDEMRLAKDQAVKANMAKTEFLANMSHEIRSPLNAILGFTQLLNMLARQKHPDLETLEILDKIHISGENLSELINNILDLSKIEARQMILNEEDLHLKQLVKGIYHINKGKAGEKNINFQYFYDDNIPDVVLLDRTKTNQIMMNLVTNAIKFTDPFGKVFLKVQADNNSISIKVEDTGTGVPGHMHESIFHPFVQADGTITRKYGGTGLGLSITRKMVHMMSGSITLESEPGKGSIFEVKLPLRAGTQRIELTEKEFTSSFIKPGVTVLLVEDNSMNQEVMKRFLDLNGFRVIIAENGEEGIIAFKKYNPEIVLMDIHMPVMDGLQATKEIRNSGNLSVPIIAISADAFNEQKENALAMGCNHYLTKPIDFTRLQEILIKFLPEYSTK
jgi:signal transduction histidine kinase/ActR/RegA family two-component response regulator